MEIIREDGLRLGECAGSHPKPGEMQVAKKHVLIFRKGDSKMG